MFEPVDGNVDFPAQELAVGQLWRQRRVYEKSLAQRDGAEPFVFYEGPPTANGLPHPGHCLTRAIKDLFPRYKTMRGYRCERKAGWDTHGLPVEVEVCKELGIHSKDQIEAYGIEPFIHQCQQSVWRYMQQWRQLTERLGFWVDMDDPYVTYHQSYVESVWWSLKNLFERDLLYQGHKIVWWWAQGGTALSAGEVGQGYREVADPSVYVKFPIVEDERAKSLGLDENTSLLVWTTTPWTLPSNQFVAVNRNLMYSLVRDSDSGERFILAGDLVKTVQAKFKRTFKHERYLRGRELFDLSYRPPFDHYWNSKTSCEWHLPDAQRYAQQEATSTAHNVQQGETLGDENFRRGQEYLNSTTPESGWQIVEGEFVTTEAGTGLVHIAPAFGEDDMRILERRRGRVDPAPGLLNPVAPDGKFTDEAPEYLRGRWVKDCDRDIIRDLKQRGLLVHQEQYVHDYPFCWRAEEDPLIQYPREGWFIRTRRFQGHMLVNNSYIDWLPEHIRDGRFGKFLESNVDWALSRERFWGTPLPIWKCEKTGKMEAVGSYGELLAKPGATGTEVWDAAKREHPDLVDDLKVHKPYIDAVTYKSRFTEGARMRRVPEVIDCWYDSGAMPFAQWGYPHTPGSEEQFKSQFPADFISEAIDQTRGWFYSQLAISTLLFSRDLTDDEVDKLPQSGSNPFVASPAMMAQLVKEEDLPDPSDRTDYPHPFRNCIVLGLMLGEDGQKMSKSKRNYREPREIFDRYGADALRWYFFANQPPWTAIRYNEQAIKDSIPEFLLRLWNVYSFFVIYANIDGFDPSEGVRMQDAGGREGSAASLDAGVFASPPTYRPIKDRNELDRWILSELHRTVATVVERMDAYDNFAACGRITEFVDALSNWYVRRSRDRFWAPDKRAPDKLDAYWTLYECLVTTARLVAPFVPFLAEALWQNLARSVFGDRAAESVHLCDYPTGDAAAIDETLSERMDLVRLIASLGRNARTSAQLKVRQPLAKVEVILADARHQAWLESHADVINEELNVKQLEFCDDPSLYVEYEVVPNFKRLGPKLGKRMPRVKQWLGEQNGAQLLASIRDRGQIDLEIDGQAIALTREEVDVRIHSKQGWTSANDRGVVVVLSTELTPELAAEGLARDLVRVIQDCRKARNCQYTDHIEVAIETTSDEIKSAVTGFGDYIRRETLADELKVGKSAHGEAKQVDVAGHRVTVHMNVRFGQEVVDRL